MQHAKGRGGHRERKVYGANDLFRKNKFSKFKNRKEKNQEIWISVIYVCMRARKKNRKMGKTDDFCVCVMV